MPRSSGGRRRRGPVRWRRWWSRGVSSRRDILPLRAVRPGPGRPRARRLQGGGGGSTDGQGDPDLLDAAQALVEEEARPDGRDDGVEGAEYRRDAHLAAGRGVREEAV